MLFLLSPYSNSLFPLASFNYLIVIAPSPHFTRRHMHCEGHTILLLLSRLGHVLSFFFYSLLVTLHC